MGTRLRSQAVLQWGISTYAELRRSDAPPPQRGQHWGQLAGGAPGSCSGFQALLPLLCCLLLLCVGTLQGRRRCLTAPSTWQLANLPFDCHKSNTLVLLGGTQKFSH